MTDSFIIQPKIDGSINELPEEMQFPNFLAPLFEVTDKTLIEIVSDEEFAEIKRIMKTFYNMSSDAALDLKNEYLNRKQEAKVFAE